MNTGPGSLALSAGLGLSLCFLSSVAIANDIEPSKEFYTAVPAPNPIVLDGDLSEWTDVPVLADPRFSVPKGSGDNGTLVFFELYDDGGPGTAVWTGPDDHTSAVQVVYDADNVYFGFVVTDEYHENAANSPWNGDSVQLMIANGARDLQVALYNYALGGVEEALGEVIIEHEAGPGGTEAVVTRNTETKRTIYEIKLPKEALGLELLEEGTQFGLGMAINDGDLDAPGQQGWGGLGAHSIVFGKTPSETALITLGAAGAGADRLFLSAINPTINSFTFRVNDKGASILDPDSVKLTIDGQEVTITASPKNLDATDFTYTRESAYPPRSEHTYSIEVRDTAGNVVTETGEFTTIYYAILNSSMQATSVNQSNPGFIWRVFQNETYTHTSLEETEMALAGELVDGSGNPITDNYADPGLIGVALGEGVLEDNLYRFEIPTVINLSQYGGEENGNFIPDDQMPGIPSLTGSDDGVDAEIITFVELPEGWVTMGVNSDDGFRMQAGFINNPADGILLGEFNGARGASDTTFRILVEDAGIYPIRTIWQDGTGTANIELFTVSEDGTKVLINDTANDGLRAFRTGEAPDRPAGGEPQVESIQVNVDGTITITWTGGTLQTAPAVTGPWEDMAGATSPHTFMPAGQILFGRVRH